MSRHAPFISMLLLIAIGGCASKRAAMSNDQINQWLARRDTAAIPVEYHVQSPDVLLITAPRMTELNDQKVVVRADGKVTLNLVGDVLVADMTPAEIARNFVFLHRQRRSAWTFEMDLRPFSERF